MIAGVRSRDLQLYEQLKGSKGKLLLDSGASGILINRKMAEKAGIESMARTDFHGIGDKGVPTRQIAETISRRLNVPVVSKSQDQATEHFGWIGRFFGMGVVASSTRTQKSLGWRPTHVGLIDDLERGTYFETEKSATVLQS